MRFRTEILALLVGLSSSMVPAGVTAGETPFADTIGIALGQSPQSAPWLAPFAGTRPACPRESHYQPQEAVRRFSLAGVRLASPGLVYKFFDERLYAVEGRLPPRQHAFAKLLDALTRRYGRPDVMEGWAGAPSDTFVYRNKLSMAGWFDRRTRQSLWLTGHDGGGSLVLTRSLSQQAPIGGVGGPFRDKPLEFAANTNN